MAWWDASDKWKELYGLSIGHKLGVNGGRTAHHLGNGLLDWQRKQADPGYFLCELKFLNNGKQPGINKQWSFLVKKLVLDQGPFWWKGFSNRP